MSSWLVVGVAILLTVTVPFILILLLTEPSLSEIIGGGVVAIGVLGAYVVSSAVEVWKASKISTERFNG